MSAKFLGEPAPADELTIESPASDQVGQLARTGAMWTLALTVTRQIVSVGSTAILARLLLPEDYGVIGMVTTLTAFLVAMSDMGLSWAVIQRRDLTMAQVHNFFWINLALGFVLATVTFASGPFLADFYGVEAVANVARVTSVTFILSSLAMQPLTLLRRKLELRPLTLMELSIYFVGTIVAIALAFAGWGYWALVAQGIVSQGLRLALAYVVSDYRPGMPSRDPATVSMLTFGGYISLSTILNYVSGNIDSVLIGRVWGAEALGYYARAYFLMTLPAMLMTGALAGVMQPALAALAHDRERMGAAYRKAVYALAFSGFPIAIGIAVTAPEAVRLVYGPNWAQVVPILAWLSGTMLASVVTSTNGWLYLATGHGRQMFLLRAFTTSLKISMLIFVVQYGPVQMAASLGIFYGILLLPLMYLAHRNTGVDFAKTVAVLRPVMGSAIVMGLASLGAGRITAAWWNPDWIVILVVKIGVGVTVYVVLAAVFLRPWPHPQLERIRSWMVSRLHFKLGRT